MILVGVSREDLARHARLKWMTHWPPAHSFLYLALMTWGIAPGPATKVLVFFCVAFGGLGWIFLARALDGTPAAMIAIGFAYPWLSFIGRAYLDYKNDHVACALAPWVYLCVLWIEPLKQIPSERWGRLVLAALLAGFTVWVKYSMAPVVAGSGLYVLYLDGKDGSAKRIRRVGIFGAFLVLPILVWLANRAYNFLRVFSCANGHIGDAQLSAAEKQTDVAGNPGSSPRRIFLPADGDTPGPNRASGRQIHRRIRSAGVLHLCGRPR